MKSLLTFLVLTLGLASVAFATSGKLSIQGHLANGGSPMDGDHTTVFAFFNAPTAGVQLWAETDTIHVVSYLFSATLGKNVAIPDTVFTSSGAWLESTIDGSTLSPRIAYYPQPQLSLSGGLDNLWSTDGTNVWRPSGTVGIGNTSPTYTLDIRSPDYLHGLNWQVTSGSETGSYVRFGSNNSRGALWIGNDTPVGGGPPDGAGLLQTTGGWQWNNQLNIMGNVGIGTNSPTNRLQVAGGITAVGVASGTFNTLGNVLGNGSVYSLTDDNHLEFHGTYGYAVGDEYVDFQSGYNPGVGGQGPMARITGYRNPEEYDQGRGRLKVSVRSGPSLTDVLTLDYQGVTIPGNLNVGGTKCRIVNTSYGVLKLNAVESAHALFMDDEPTARLVNGRCRVTLSPKFMATVTVNGKWPLAVNVTVYGRHGEWYVERDTSGFTVIDPAGGNNEFSWQAIARQKNYEDTDLDSAIMTAAK